MTELEGLTPAQREDLVAYLDGELTEATCQEVEALLARSAEARREVEALTRVADLLDALPPAAASDQFTARTLSSIRVEGVPQPRLNGAGKRRVRQGAAFAVAAAGLMLAAGLGFLTTQRWIPTDSERIVEELPLLDRLDVYSEIGSVDFLRDLQRSGLFNGEKPND
jgi:anti-sigma factor RsiW